MPQVLHVRLKPQGRRGDTEALREALLNTSGVEDVDVTPDGGEVRISGVIDRESATDVIQQLGFELED